MSSEVPLLADELIHDIADSPECNPDRSGWGAKFDFELFARAIEQAVRAQWAAEVKARDEEMRVTQGVFRNLQQAANDTVEMLAKAVAERDSAQAEAKRNAKDAARYRLLTEVHGPRSELCFDGEVCAGKAEFDALIDAKLAALQPGEQT